MNDPMKRKRDYLFVYMMILALVLFVSGFYLGGVIVKGKYVDQIRMLSEVDQDGNEKPAAKYLQTDFVSFYYGVLEPFNHLKREHFTYIDHINNKDAKYDYKAKGKELLELSKTVLTRMAETNISNSAPLLIQAKQSYMESLTHYQKGIGGLLNKESMPQEIMKFNSSWLLAQKQFYQSVSEWEKMYEAKNNKLHVLTEQEYEQLTLADWSQISLHQKNYYISMLMEQQNYLLPYQPEEISIHIDALVNYEALSTLGIDQIEQAIQFFIAANAINYGDFLKEKEKYYANVATPLIPLYLVK